MQNTTTSCSDQQRDDDDDSRNSSADENEFGENAMENFFCFASLLVNPCATSRVVSAEEQMNGVVELEEL